jgi:hypothetical protein
MVMNMRRFFLWVFSFLLGGFSIYFIVEKFVFGREEQPTIGYYWFLPCILIVVLFAVNQQGAFPGIVISLFIGLLTVILLGGPMLYSVWVKYPLLTPGVYTTFSGLGGSMVGRQLDKGNSNSMPKWEIGLAIVGSILGFVIGFFIYAGSVG